MRTTQLLSRLLALTALTFEWNCVYAQEKEHSAVPAPRFVGIGVELKPTHDALSVISILPFSPAARAGLQPGDRISAIDGQLISKFSLDEAAKALQGKNGSHVILTVASAGLPPVQVRVLREWIEARPAEHAAADRVEIAAAREHLLSLQRGEWQRQFEARFNKNLDRLRGPLEMQVRFMRKVGRLSVEQAEQLKDAGERKIRHALSPRESGFPGRWVRHEVVINNGQSEVRDELNESPRSIVRSELAPVLESISSEAAARFEGECERLDWRRRTASIQVQLAAFDEALLITREQRERLGKLLDARWTDVWRGHANERDVMDPIALCQTAVGAMDLFTIPDVELQAVLRPSQVATFKLVQLPTRVVSVFVQDGPAKRFVRRGLPIEEERLRLKLLLERLVDDAAAHADLDDEQKQRLLTAGKLDLESHFNQFTALEDKSAGLIIVRGNQITGVKAPFAAGIHGGRCDVSAGVSQSAFPGATSQRCGSGPRTGTLSPAGGAPVVDGRIGGAGFADGRASRAIGEGAHRRVRVSRRT